ncbi:MAG: hypothetical protein HC933_18045 [Pleurocapsa sp. SU_196_0]|nr:hypothetical protein [Pleurocapsa sp. SU_196_0]
MHIRRWLSAFTLTALFSACIQTPEPTVNARPAAVSDALIYGDALSTGWENWSWSVNGVDFASTGYYSGTKSIRVDARPGAHCHCGSTAPPSTRTNTPV